MFINTADYLLKNKMVEASRYLAIIFALVLFISLASAGFDVGDLSHSIQEIYGKGDYIKGWVNISFTDAASDSLFEYSDNSVRLIDLLNENPDYDYSCNPLDCLTDYGASNGETTKNFNLNAGNSEIFGLKFTGNIVSVNSISFDVQSNASSSCFNQLKIDFLDDGSIEAQNNKTSVDVCSTKNYGCFDSGQSTEEPILSTVPYCQKIELLESPGFLVGAWIKNVSGSSETLTMELYKNDGLSVGTCELPQTTSSGSEVSCEIDHVVTDKENYYVCINASSGEEYKIRANSNPSDGCGLYGIPPSSNTPGAYEIFAQGKKFDSVGTLEISNSLPYGNTLNVLVQDYLQDRYGIDLNCTGECVVPIRFLSQENQAITIENLNVKYEKTSGLVSEDKFYDLADTPAIINSGYQKLYLDNGNFSVPNSLGDYTFSLDFEGIEVFSEEVSVEDVPIIEFVRPTITASAYPTPFEVGIDSSSEIMFYDWDFGDNGTARTSENKTTHTYVSTGNYILTIDVRDSEGLSASRTFQIEVGLPDEVINSTLKNFQNGLENVKTQIAGQDLFSQKSLNSTLRISFVEEEIKNLETNFSLATSEEEYNQILSRLLELDVPESVTKSRSSADFITFFPEADNIDVDVLQIIGGGDFDKDKRDRYVDSILIWNHENLETKINFKEFSAEYESSIKPVLRVFELRLEEIGDAGPNPYLIIEDLDGLKFDKSYLEKEESGYVYISLDDFPVTIKFSTTEDIDFVDLPAFVAPPVNSLSISEDIITDGDNGTSKWTIFILIILFLALSGLITYIVLQQWYKKKYEDYLFRNRTDLYNMVTYVNNAKKRGLKREEIADNLRKSGWNSEKVRYVMKKYAGKRTGMFEIPVTNILEKIKKKDNSKKYSK